MNNFKHEDGSNDLKSTQNPNVNNFHETEKRRTEKQTDDTTDGDD